MEQTDKVRNVFIVLNFSMFLTVCILVCEMGLSCRTAYRHSYQSISAKSETSKSPVMLIIGMVSMLSLLGRCITFW